MTLHSITFVHPTWLLAGVLCAAVVLVLGMRLDRQRRAALALFSSRRIGAASSLSRPLRMLKRALLVAGVLLGCAALARPQRGFRWEEAHQRGIDLLFAVDTSKSMLAPDLKPNRLARAKLAIRDLMPKLGGDRVGLVAFAGDAFLQCPLTLDRDMFDQTLDAVDTTMIPRGGTDVGRAIEVARAALQNQPANQKLLVFLTDGEDLEAQAVEAARSAAKDGVRIFAIGVGTPGGELIPISAEAGRFVRDESGAFVRSKLDEKTLQAMTSVAGGEYRRLGADGRGLEAVYQEVLAKQPHAALGSRMRQVPIERFQWPLGGSVLFLALEPLIRERRRRRRAWAEPPMRGPKFAALRRRAVAALAIGFVVPIGRVALASPRDAERAYHEGRFQQSSEEYARALARSPDDAKLQYNLGAAAYKTGDFAKAGAALEQALRSDRLDLQENAYYDIGNTLFRIGQKTIEKQPEQTIEQWKKSIASYESAVKLDAKDADALANRDLVKRKLAELERKQKQNQQGKPPQKDQQSKQDQNQQNQNQQNQNQPGTQNPKDPQGQNQQQSQNQPGQHNKQNQTRPGQQNGQAKEGQGQQPQPDESGERGSEAAVPGRLSRRDAKALLDALRGDERLMPIAPAGQPTQSSDDVVRKDW